MSIGLAGQHYPLIKRRDLSVAGAAMAAVATLGPLAVAGRWPASASGRGAGSKPPSIGTNLSGMEWARPGLRFGLSSMPNLHFSVPRKVDVGYLAASGFLKNRLPIQWELLQPMLHDSRADAAARAAIGEPGHFHSVYESYITGVLDAHAAVGATCIIDNHNYCRYQDFCFQPDGSVAGLTSPPNSLMRPYTRDPKQVQVRIFSLAEGATLTVENFVDFWSRAARKWKDHPGFGGYGLMNEPHHMPRPGETTATTEDGPESPEDLTIWPTFAQAAIDAIRVIDPDQPIYVAGNKWSSAMAMATHNPGFPLAGAGLIYEVHLYLDAFSNGAAFDYATEVAKNYSAGFGRGPIGVSTGLDRLRLATDWARDHKVPLALGEIGMPTDEPQWQEMFRRTALHAHDSGCEIYTWMGGSHWQIRNYAINQVPGWHQNKTLEPLVAGVLKEAAGINAAMLFDDGPVYGNAGEALPVTVHARGNLSKPLGLTITTTGGGKLQKSRITIPAGANGRAGFIYIPAADEFATLRYAVDGGPKQSPQLPPPRRVSSIANPVAHAENNLADAAMTVLGKYSASKWDMADACTDYVLGRPAAAGQAMRAVADSAYGSSPSNTMEMLNWFNNDSLAMGAPPLPILRATRQAQQYADLSAPGTVGLWCKKTLPVALIQPRPKNRAPFDLQDEHFVIAAVTVVSKDCSGIVFQASQAEAGQTSELAFSNGRPQARWVEAKGRKVVITGDKRLTLNQPCLLALTSAKGAQTLRVDGVEVASASAIFAPAFFAQMLIGWGFLNFYPVPGFQGHVYAVIAGKGNPSAAELAVLEHYLAGRAGIGMT
jgi:hypothetical protein